MNEKRVFPLLESVRFYQRFEMLFDDAIEFLLFVDRLWRKTMRCLTKILALLLIRKVGEKKKMRDQTNQFGRIRQFVERNLLLLLRGSIATEDRRTFDAQQQ